MYILRKSLLISKRLTGKYLFLTILLVEKGFACILKRKNKNLQNKKENIIIIGGLSNRGDQALSFTVIDLIKKRFSDKIVYLFINSDYEGDIKERNIYNFKIINWSSKYRNILSCATYKHLINNHKHSNLERKFINIFKNTAFIIDAEGFRLTSDQKHDSWLSIFLEIIIAKKFSIPYFIFPQSIGPFDFPLKKKIYFIPLAKLLLKYPKKILVRDNEGLKYIKQFRKDNVEKTFDIVLLNEDYNLSNIYKENINFKNFNIKLDSVCIIPNSKVFERAKSNDIYSIYSSLIKKLINANKTIYILKHSFDDSVISVKIKELFHNNEKIILISDDLNAIELQSIIKKFDFIIASRYHSIIHAYKNLVPALVIGWSFKYYELLKPFNQIEYIFDIRKKISIEDISIKLEEMIINYEIEKEKIKVALYRILKKRNWFVLTGLNEFN